MRTKELSDFQGADMIDVRDIIARVEELRDEREQSEITPEQYGGLEDSWKEERQELATLEAFLDELRGNGGDEQWEGEWYPVTLIRESYFETAMDEMLEDIGNLPRNLPCYLKITVDYDALKMDYTSADLEGTTYYFR